MRRTGTEQGNAIRCARGDGCAYLYYLFIYLFIIITIIIIIIIIIIIYLVVRRRTCCHSGCPDAAA